MTFFDVSREGPVVRLTLNRPEARNAFNDEFIRSLTAWAGQVRDDRTVRVVVLRGAGKTFCAGADVDWMARMARYTPEENVADARALAGMFEALDTLPMVLIGRVQGAALGGGAGLAAICDIVVAAADAEFGFTEARLGILPATIAPYALAKIGVAAARELFLTGMRFDATRAREIGLVHAVVAPDHLDAAVARYANEVLAAGPEAVATAKQLIRAIAWRSPADVASLTADTIAARRISDEGQEGLRAFLEKRTPRFASDR